MPVYPGTEPPLVEPANTYEKDGFKETRISMFSHTETHMDPPALAVRTLTAMKKTLCCAADSKNQAAIGRNKH